MAEHREVSKEFTPYSENITSTIKNDTEPFRKAYTQLIELRYKDCEDATEYCDKFAEHLREVEAVHKQLIPRFQKHNLFMLGLGPAGEKNFHSWVKEKRSEPQTRNVEELIDDFKKHIAERKAKEDREKKHREEKRAAKGPARKRGNAKKPRTSIDQLSNSQDQEAPSST